MKKLMLLGLSMIVGMSVMAEVQMGGLYTKLAAKQFDELQAQVDNNMKSFKEMSVLEQRQNIMYLVVIPLRKGEMSYTDAVAKVDELAKQYGMTDEIQIFLCKYYVLNPWWNQQKSDELSNQFQADNIDKVVGWVKANDPKNWYSEFLPILSRNGYTDLALEYGLRKYRVECITYASKMSPEKTIEVANTLLFKGNLPAKDVDKVVTVVLDTCYDVKYNDAVKALLTNANNKFYKNIGKNAEWKAACTTIQLGLKRFN